MKITVILVQLGCQYLVVVLPAMWKYKTKLLGSWEHVAGLHKHDHYGER